MPSPDALQVAVLGASGYVGGELLRLLSAHPAVAAVEAYSESAAGRPWGEVHPALLHAPRATFRAVPAAGVGDRADVVFLAVPHGRAQLLVPDLLASPVRLIVDTSADFRLHDQVRYEAAYGPHAAPEALGEFVYGLADVVGGGLAGRRAIASPGCFATAALLALYPFARAGLLKAPPTVFAITGSSGAGAEPRPTTHHPVRGHSFFGYSLAGHRHEAEIGEQLAGWCGGGVGECCLLTHAAPLIRGIHATVLLRLDEPLPEPAALVSAAYAGRPFVAVLDRPPAVAEVVGTNYAHLHAIARGEGREVVVTVAVDNLVKGAAGQAIQSMNLALGLEETQGLASAGIFPC